MNIKILKLVNGDDIISDVDRSDKILLKNPARLMMFPSEDGGMGMALVPWCPYTEQEEFSIDPSHVMIEIEEKDVPEELRNEYNDKFGSGLVAPPKNIIV